MILDDYAVFLTSLGIQFSRTNGFSVWIRNIMISLSASRSGMITLESYVGLVSYGKRNADRLTAALVDAFPRYKIYPDKYSGYYEIEVDQNFPYTSVDALHEQVVIMVEMIEQSYQIGTEMLGRELFHR